MSNLHPHWRLNHARGYLTLGLVDAAAEELAELPPDWLAREEVMILQAGILQEQGEWLRLQPLAATLARAHPEAPEWWVMWAYATRRAESLPAANDILREAETRHPTEGTIQFNLGCYACQLGDLREARLRLAKAMALDKRFAESWLSDPDFAPLKDTGWRP